MRYAALSRLSGRRSDLAIRQRTHGDTPLPRVAACGVRAASDVGRCASRGSTAAPLSAHRAPLRHQTSRSTTPSMSKAAEI